jgi:molecular chaperone DnaJ
MKDYYAILGLPTSATAAEVDAAFRGLARKYHPDLQPVEEDAVAHFKSATEAHDVLSDATKRRQYDKARSCRRREPVGTRKHPGSVPPTSVGPAAAWVKTPLMSLRPVEATAVRGPDIDAELRLAPEEAARGGLIQLRIPIVAACAACQGLGQADGCACTACRGEGLQRRPHLVQLNLPARLRDGDVLRIPVGGGALAPGAPCGDLHLRVRVRPCW